LTTSPWSIYFHKRNTWRPRFYWTYAMP